MKKLNFIKFLIFLFFTLSFSNLSQTIHQTSFCRHGLNKFIPSFATVYDTINVNLPGAISVIDINVILDTVLHGWDGDLEFYLVHVLQSDSLITHRGSSGDNFINTLLNDSASLHISQGLAPFTGSYRPERPLTLFNGSTPNGSWILKIVSNTGGDTGFLRAWCLQVTYTSPTGIILVNNNIPDKFSLYQNFPNPFNPATKIKFSLPNPPERGANNVKLIVYDIMGREVTSLIHPGQEGLQPGTYEVEFDGSVFSSGVYYYKLETETFTETKRMVLIK